MAKMRENWTKCGPKQWDYKRPEGKLSWSNFNVFQYVQCGKVRYEVHFMDARPTRNEAGVTWVSDFKRFDSREDAMIFVENAEAKHGGYYK